MIGGVVVFVIIIGVILTILGLAYSLYNQNNSGKGVRSEPENILSVEVVGDSVSSNKVDTDGVDWNRLSTDESNEPILKKKPPTVTVENNFHKIQTRVDQQLLSMLNKINVEELNNRYSGILDKKRSRCNARSEYIEVLCRNVSFFNLAMDKYYDKFHSLINASVLSESALKEFDDFINSIQGNKSLVDQNKVQLETASYNRIDNSISLLETKYVSGSFKILITGNTLRYLLSNDSLLEDLRKSNIFKVIDYLKTSSNLCFKNTIGKMVIARASQSARDNFAGKI